MLNCFKVSDELAVRVDVQVIEDTVKRILFAVGIPEDAAAVASNSLVYADLHGIDSHGISNLVPTYLQRIERDEINPLASMSMIKDDGATMSFDCDRGLGATQGQELMVKTCDRADQTGIAITNAHNGSHFGTCAYYVNIAIERDMIGLCMTSGGLYMTPTFGSKPIVGINPIGFGAPSNNEIPFLFDASMSSVSSNKIKLLRRLDRKVFPSWIADMEGQPINRATNVPTNYMMLPLGSTREIGSHKGFSLAVMIEVLCSLLAGTGGGPHRRKGVAHTFVAIDIKRFCEIDTFKDDMDCYLRTLLDCPTTPQDERVVYAGVLEHETAKERRSLGIPYHPEVIEWMLKKCEELNVKSKLRL